MSRELKILFSGQVDKSGKLKISNRKLFDDRLLMFCGKWLDGSLKIQAKTANERQRGYLWAVVYVYIAKGFRDAGYQGFSTHEAHAFLKDKFKPGYDIADPETGEIVRLITTENISAFEKATYTQQCRQFSEEFLNTIIPDPDPLFNLQTNDNE